MTIYRCAGCWRLYGVGVLDQVRYQPWTCECGGEIAPFYGINLRTYAEAAGWNTPKDAGLLPDRAGDHPPGDLISRC